jgi:hypothetical protein
MTKPMTSERLNALLRAAADLFDALAATPLELNDKLRLTAVELQRLLAFVNRDADGVRLWRERGDELMKEFGVKYVSPKSDGNGK